MLKQVEELKFSTKISEEKAVSEIVTLNDQKKMLVKEVKQCRKKLDELSEVLEREQGEKSALITKYSELERQLESQKQQEQKQRQQ